MRKMSVLFVCLGNICRSPLAEAIFREEARRNNAENYFTIDSCGTGNWHVGERAHSRTMKIALDQGISLEAHRARQVETSDFDAFSLIVAMDQANYRDLERMGAKEKTRLILLREFDDTAEELDVPDPYYSGPDGFHVVQTIITRCCKNLLKELTQELNLSKDASGEV